MITRNTLKSLKTELIELEKLCDTMLNPLVTKDKLFDTQADYYEAMKNQNRVPQDFYKIQIFDLYVYLEYNFKFKVYYLRSESGDVYENLGMEFDKALLRFLEFGKALFTARFNELQKELTKQLDLF